MLAESDLAAHGERPGCGDLATREGWRGVVTKVHQTGGNRSGLTGYWSNQSGLVPVWTGTKPAQIQNSNFNSKKMKNSQKIPKNNSRCDESNGVKFSKKFEVKPKKKRKK